VLVLSRAAPVLSWATRSAISSMRLARPEAEAEFYARFSGGPVAFTRPGQPVAPAAPKPSAPGPQQVKPRPASARKSPEKPWIGVMTARPHHKIEDLSWEAEAIEPPENLQ
jgi:hypothetical protein